MQNEKRAVLRREKTLSGATIHSEDYLSKSGAFCPVSRKFAVSERTAALLSLVVELDMVVERVGRVLTDSEVEWFVGNISDARETLIQGIRDNIIANLGMIANIRKSHVEI